MTGSASPALASDCFHTFLQPQDVALVRNVLALVDKAYPHDAAQGVHDVLAQPALFAQQAQAYQDRVDRRQRTVASLMVLVVLAMLYVMYRGFVTPGVGMWALPLPALIAVLAGWQLERSMAQVRQGDVLRYLLSALDGQPYSFDAAAFAAWWQQQPALAARCPQLPSAAEMALQHLVCIKHHEQHPAAG